MTENQTIKERLISFIAYLGMGQGKFEKECGLANGYVNNIRKSVSPDKLQIIARRFPELNSGWLMTGEGEMLRSAEGGNVTSTTDNRRNSDYLTFNGHNNQVINSSCGRDIINGSDGRQDAADERIRLLEELLKEKERTIQILLGQIKKSDKSNNN